MSITNEELAALDAAVQDHDAHTSDGWDDVEAQQAAGDEATMEERARCEALVQGEMELGRLRGVPATSGVMVILHRIAAAIRNG